VKSENRIQQDCKNEREVGQQQLEIVTVVRCIEGGDVCVDEQMEHYGHDQRQDAHADDVLPLVPAVEVAGDIPGSAHQT
jgi:hypothetical protein